MFENPYVNGLKDKNDVKKRHNCYLKLSSGVKM